MMADGGFLGDLTSAASTTGMPATCITVCESVAPWHSTLLPAASLSIIDYSFPQVERYNDVVEGENEIVFAQPHCPKIYWADLDEGPHFAINIDKAADDDESLLLTVFNPSYTDSPLVNATRMETVPLWYREVGDRGWERARGKDTEVLDFTTNVESPYGYATAEWDYEPIADGAYELMAETRCDTIEGAPMEFNRFSDSPITVVLDRKAPQLHGLPTPNNGSPLWPGDEVTFAFSEPVLCQKPYPFAFSVTVEGQIQGGVANKARVFDNDDLSIICERNEIRFTFDQTSVDLNDLNGKPFSVVLTGVRDYVGNYYGVLLDNGTLIENQIIHAVRHATINPMDASVWFEADMMYPDCPTNEDEMRSEVATYTGIDQQTIVVESVSCSDDGTGDVMVAVTYKIMSKTQLAAEDSDIVSVPHLARKLMDASSSQDAPLLRARNLRIVLGESDQRRRAEDLIQQKAALDSTKLDSSNEFVLEQLRLIRQKLEEDRMTDRLKLEEDRMADRLKLEEDRETDRLKQEEDREMLKSVMQMLKQKQSSGMKQQALHQNSVIFPMITCLLGVVASCLVMSIVGKGRKEKQDAEASIL